MEQRHGSSMRLQLQVRVGQRQVRLAGCFGVRPGATSCFVAAVGTDQGGVTMIVI